MDRSQKEWARRNARIHGQFSRNSTRKSNVLIAMGFIALVVAFVYQLLAAGY